MKYQIVETKDGQTLLTILSAEEQPAGKLNPRAVVGKFEGLKKGEAPEIKKLKHNKQFLKLFHRVVMKEAMKAEAFIEMAKKMKDGKIPIIDMRTKNKEEVPEKNLIALLAVKDGKIVDYLMNAKYRAVDDDGIFRLPKEVETELKKELMG